jgi:hypothetical protein
MYVRFSQAMLSQHSVLLCRYMCSRSVGTGIDPLEIPLGNSSSYWVQMEAFTPPCHI